MKPNHELELIHERIDIIRKVDEMSVRASEIYREPVWIPVVAGCCILAGLVGLRILNDSSLWKRWIERGSHVRSLVGELDREAGGVRLRESGELVWFDLGLQREPVGKGDTLFTNETGLAHLHLSGGVTVKIPPGTELFIRESEASSGGLKRFFGLARETPELRLARGELQVDFSSGSGALRFEIDGRTVELIPDEAVQRDSQSIHIRQGEVDSSAKLEFLPSTGTQFKMAVIDQQAKREDSVRLLKSNAVVDFISSHEGGSLVERSFRPITPRPGEKKVVRENSGSSPREFPVRLSWEWSGSKKPAKVSTLLTVEGSAHRTIVLSPGIQRATVDLPPGQFRWSVEEEGVATSGIGKNEVKEWSEFELLELGAPRILWPPDRHQIMTDQNEEVEVRLSWSSTFGETTEVSTELEIQREGSRDGRTVAKIRDSEFLIRLAPADYVWRVRSKMDRPSGGSTGRVLPWSRFYSFSIKKSESHRAIDLAISKLLKPEILTEGGAETSQKPYSDRGRLTLLPTEVSHQIQAQQKLGTRSVLIQWATVPGVLEYEVSLFNSTGSKVEERVVTQPRLELSLTGVRSSGWSYEIRTRGQAPTGQVLASGHQELRFTLEAPELRRPGDGQKMNLNSPIYLTWSRVEPNDQFRFQVARDPSFNVILMDEGTNANIRSLSNLLSGTYYWRVRCQNHGSESNWSRIGFFVIP